MPRPFRARALAAVLATAAAGCQDYNFNPVGHCLLQPGSEKFTLSNISSADVLFVVDDSGSMAGEQTRLAAAFEDFVENLTSTNGARAQAGLLPLDFHVAVTTSSVFENGEPLGATQTCRSDCAGAGGQLACCVGTTPVFGPRACKTLGATTAECPVAGTACRNTCDRLKGESYCCAADGSFPADAINSVGGAIVRCSVAGISCGQLQTHYAFAGLCDPATRGAALDEFPYPDGGFVGSAATAAPAANPRVLHFDKRLYQSADGKNGQGFTRAQLEAFFKDNVAVGTCGSRQEQGLAASRSAVEKALAGLQRDTYTYDRAIGANKDSVPSTSLQYTVTNGIPAPGAPAAWPGPASKLVVVWVGDEDDCSSPEDPSGGVVLLRTDASGHDACTRDVTEAAPLGRKQTALSSFVDYFTGLGRPFGAAFVVSARAANDPTSCSGDACFAALCTDPACSGPADVCGGQAPGTRFVEAASQFKAKGADVVLGSVCGDFRPLLREVADIVKPPQTLSLPTLPAESRIAMLRIADATGSTRKICGRPLPPKQPNYTRQEAEATAADWWFVATGDPGPPYDPTGAATVAAPSRFVYINPKGACIANPGETYSADYLGVVPATGAEPGCKVLTGDVDPTGAVLGSADCRNKLGGQFADWECFTPPGLSTGTCTCRSGG